MLWMHIINEIRLRYFQIFSVYESAHNWRNKERIGLLVNHDKDEDFVYVASRKGLSLDTSTSI